MCVGGCHASRGRNLLSLSSVITTPLNEDWQHNSPTRKSSPWPFRRTKARLKNTNEVDNRDAGLTCILSESGCTLSHADRGSGLGHRNPVSLHRAHLQQSTSKSAETGPTPGLEKQTGDTIYFYSNSQQLVPNGSCNISWGCIWQTVLSCASCNLAFHNF